MPHTLAHVRVQWVANPLSVHVYFGKNSGSSRDIITWEMIVSKNSADNPPQTLDDERHRHPALQNIPVHSSRPFLHETLVPCIDILDDVDAIAEAEHCSYVCSLNGPMRKINLCKDAAPPRRFHRTFWRGLVVTRWSVCGNPQAGKRIGKQDHGHNLSLRATRHVPSKPEYAV
jgi:hypothetical protein